MKTTAHIDLTAISNNYRFFKERISPAMVIPVVKANAYGQGVLAVVRHLVDQFDLKLFAVATLEEAIELCDSFPQVRVLIFSRVFKHELNMLPDNAILSIGSLEDAEDLLSADITGLEVHLNINTGMNRLGLAVNSALDLIKRNEVTFSITGVYSHFSSSDTLSVLAYEKQVSLFKGLMQEAPKLGFEGIFHLSNSAGGLKENPIALDAMRLGIGLYGYDTSASGEYQDQLVPVMEVKAPLVRVDHIQAGEAVSYAEKWISTTETNIGTLRIGYADGYDRRLTNRGMVSLKGKSYPVIGTVTMDHIMIDLGSDDPPCGSEFTVLGGTERLHQIATIASELNTITYEICCAISPRVIRIYSR